MPAHLAPGHPRPGKGLGDLFLSQFTVTGDRGHRSQAGIPAGPVEVCELVLFVPHTLQTRQPADPLTSTHNPSQSDREVSDALQMVTRRTDIRLPSAVTGWDSANASGLVPAPPRPNSLGREGRPCGREASVMS